LAPLRASSRFGPNLGRVIFLGGPKSLAEIRRSESPLAQLNLPLLETGPLALPAGKHQQLMQALIELLLSAASAPAAGEGENHEPQADR
jgi:hypothetical protein